VWRLNGYEGYDEGCSSHSTAYLNEYAYSSKALAEYISINGPTVTFSSICIHGYFWQSIFNSLFSSLKRCLAAALLHTILQNKSVYYNNICLWSWNFKEISQIITKWKTEIVHSNNHFDRYFLCRFCMFFFFWENSVCCQIW